MIIFFLANELYWKIAVCLAWINWNMYSHFFPCSIFNMHKISLFPYRNYTILGPQGLMGTSRQRFDANWLWIYRCFYSPIFKMDVKKTQENGDVLLKKALVSTGRYGWAQVDTYWLPQPICANFATCS